MIQNYCVCDLIVVVLSVVINLVPLLLDSAFAVFVLVESVNRKIKKEHSFNKLR